MVAAHGMRISRNDPIRGCADRPGRDGLGPRGTTWPVMVAAHGMRISRNDPIRGDAGRPARDGRREVRIGEIVHGPHTTVCRRSLPPGHHPVDPATGRRGRTVSTEGRELSSAVIGPVVSGENREPSKPRNNPMRQPATRRRLGEGAVVPAPPRRCPGQDRTRRNVESGGGSLHRGNRTAVGRQSSLPGTTLCNVRAGTEPRLASRRQLVCVPCWRRAPSAAIVRSPDPTRPDRRRRAFGGWSYLGGSPFALYPRRAAGTYAAATSAAD